MSGTIQQIRGVLAATLDTIAGLEVAERALQSATLPAAQVFLPDLIAYSGGSAGVDKMRFRLLVVVSRSSSDDGESELAGYLDSSGAPSVRATLERNPTLGGLIDDLAVLEAEVGFWSVGAVEVLGAMFTVDVWARENAA